MSRKYLCTNCNYSFQNRNNSRVLVCPYCSQAKYIMEDSANKLIEEI